MANIDINFTFENVGQGLFYIGEVNNFRFIYDCGSQSRSFLSDAISRHKSNFELLILSHLHSDHVNGIEELLKESKINIVIIPYYSPIERLIIALKNRNQEEWYYRFISDPVEYLYRDVELIVFLGKGKDKTSDYFRENRLNNDFSLSEDRVNIDDLEDDNSLIEVIKFNDSEWLTSKKYKNKVRVKAHNSNLKIYKNWIFRFYNHKVTDRNLEVFKSCIGDQFGRIDNNIIRDIIIDEKRLKQLRNCYQKLNKDLNHTSLMLYHGPLCKKGNVRVEVYPICLEDRENILNLIYLNSNSSPVKILGQFLTGDIDLNKNKKEIINHFKNYLKYIYIIQVPHHMSKKNWNWDFYSKIPNKALWIASAGISNRYNHPNVNLIKQLLDKKAGFFWCNELNKLKIKGYVTN